jgi:hypothetical protein
VSIHEKQSNTESAVSQVPHNRLIFHSSSISSLTR